MVPGEISAHIYQMKEAGLADDRPMFLGLLDQIRLTDRRAIADQVVNQPQLLTVFGFSEKSSEMY